MRKALFGVLLVELWGCEKPTTRSVHSATLTWTASPSSGVTGYNVYRAPCTGTITGSTCSQAGAFTKINAAVVTGLTYTDTAVTAATAYDYYATAVCSACSPSESGPSVHFAGTIPPDVPPQPQPPSNLTITTVARTSKGSSTQIAASWTAVPGTRTNYSVLEGTAIVTAGNSAGDAAGKYSMNWSGKVTPPSSPLLFRVCDATGYCVTQAI